MLCFVAIAAALSAAVAYGFYDSSVSWFREHKSEQNITALGLVEAFVADYSDLRAKLGANAPEPDSFRVHAIERFNHENGTDFHLSLVGRKDRAIAEPPNNPKLAQAIEAFNQDIDHLSDAELLSVDHKLVFRSLYPSFARQQSCVDCHNQLQPGLHWQIGDLMGAYLIDEPAGPFLRESAIQATELGLALLLALSGVGMVVALLHFRQIAERETAQASFEASEERFRDFAETASDWFWEQDADLRFTFVSRGAPDEGSASVIGKTRAELVKVGRHFGLSEEQWRAHEDEVRERRPFQNLRFQRLSGDGTIHHISVSGRPVFDEAGKFLGYRGTGRDLTDDVAVELELARRVEERTAELRTAQSELLRKERLSTLGQLTATVAHELRNPLSAIRNTIFAVKETVANAGLNLERPLSRVERNITRCDRIISDLLDFTRMRELNCSRVEADGWLDEVVQDQRLPPGIKLRAAYGAPGQRLNFDVERMRRVVINLIENAAHAMADGPAPEGQRFISISTSATGGCYAIAIEDNGPGIPAEIMARVFEPLFSTKSFGTGLGLPTVKQIVEQHDGTVEIASEPGKGTQVVVRLPNPETKELAA